VQYNNPNVTAVTVPVTLDEKLQYLILNGIVMTLKQKLVEENGVPYMKQEKLMFIFTSEQFNSSLLRAM
jgi:hypothetical protein